jgi:glutathione synthase/RimK-type ligase-like ATP-grasp enzyme
MRSTKALIITSKEDSHADLIIDKLNHTGLGEKIVRLNTEDFWHNSEIVAENTNIRCFLKDSNRTFSTDEIASVWFRRPKSINVKHENKDAIDFIEMQCNALLRGIYFCTHDTAIWVNPLTSLHRSRIKLQQLQLAKKLGFTVPNTLVTNNASAAVDFARSNKRICTKSLDEPSFQINNNIFPIYTRVITEKEIADNSDSIKTCPSLFQEFVEKQYDVRVTIVGNKLFPFRIYSQDSEYSKVDFRELAPARQKHELIELPNQLENLIFEFMGKQGLVYSAMDFAVTSNGTYFFLENNANGQWQWLDEMIDGKISDAMIDLLFNVQFLF